jgi:glucokinase
MIRVGIDVGGTGIQVGVVDENLKILFQNSFPTDISLPFGVIVRQMTESVRSAVSSAGFTLADVTSVGVGIPGIADQATGDIVKCANMKWFHVPFRSEFQRLLDLPVFIDNDANVAALAESVAGVSRGTSSSVFITIGTGIGSGIILNGKIWSGFHGIGAELGHVIFRHGGVPCSCGNRGCLERYCSATALIRMGREAMAENPDTLMMRMTEGNPARLNARIVIDAARERDPLAEKVYREYIDYLSQAIASVVNLLDPEVVVLGGGVSKAGAFLLDPILEEYPKHVVFNDQPMPSVKLAVLGPEAGIIGAAMLS